MPRPSLPAAAVPAALNTDLAAGPGVRIPPHQRYTLANGVKLILIPRHDVPLIAFEALLRGGARLDAEGREGVTSLTAELLTHGAGSRDAYAFADAVEGAGGSFDADAHSEAILVHGQFLARDSELLLGLLADALQRPRLPPDELTSPTFAGGRPRSPIIPMASRSAAVKPALAASLARTC